MINIYISPSTPFEDTERREVDMLRISTLPVLFSTDIAFLLASMHRAPASTVVIVDGGVYRSPGPSLRGRDELEGIGRCS